MSHIQALVSSQTEVNRAVFLMNARNNRHSYGKSLDDADLTDDKIAGHIREAIGLLHQARIGYELQPDLFGEEA